MRIRERLRGIKAGATVAKKMKEAVDKGRLTKEQIKTVGRGIGILAEIKGKLKGFEKELKQAAPHEIEKQIVLEDKIARLKKMLLRIMANDIEAMRKIAKEYENKYPGDFGT